MIAKVYRFIVVSSLPVIGLPSQIRFAILQTMILAVTLNLAIDKVARASRLNLGGETRIDLVSNLPGGKGVNAARAVRSFGQQVTVTGLVGGRNGEFIEEGLHQEGIVTRLFSLDGESRVCLIVIDDHQQVSEIYERGLPVPSATQQGYLEYFRRNCQGYPYTMVCGSLPPGFPSDYYAELLRFPSGRKCLDSHGSQVLHALR